MEVLVDYDNLGTDVKRNGLFALCAKLGAIVGSRRDFVPENCRVRLYGGWYDESGLTRQAQRIISEIDVTFPDPVAWTARLEQGKCVTQVEMAYTLLAEPGRHLLRTLRNRKFRAKIKCDTAVFGDCNEKYCPMREVADFLDQQKCPTYACSVLQEDVLYKWEQKLVDTMITSDLIFFAHQGEKDLIVVSSDDDMWPGVRTALEFGANITLVQTRQRQTSADYTRGVAGFEQVTL